MKCKRCNKEFPGSDIIKGSYDSVSYTYSPICPYCGYNNGLKVRM